MTQKLFKNICCFYESSLLEKFKEFTENSKPLYSFNDIIVYIFNFLQIYFFSSNAKEVSVNCVH